MEKAKHFIDRNKVRIQKKRKRYVLNFNNIPKSIAIDKLEECFDRTIPRGPDMTRLIETPIGYMGFHRLAIMGLTEEVNAALFTGAEYAGM